MRGFEHVHLAAGIEIHGRAFFVFSVDHDHIARTKLFLNGQGKLLGRDDRLKDTEALERAGEQRDHHQRQRKICQERLASPAEEKAGGAAGEQGDAGSYQGDTKGAQCLRGEVKKVSERKRITRRVATQQISDVITWRWRAGHGSEHCGGHKDGAANAQKNPR